MLPVVAGSDKPDRSEWVGYDPPQRGRPEQIRAIAGSGVYSVAEVGCAGERFGDAEDAEWGIESRPGSVSACLVVRAVRIDLGAIFLRRGDVLVFQEGRRFAGTWNVDRK